MRTITHRAFPCHPTPPYCHLHFNRGRHYPSHGTRDAIHPTQAQTTAPGLLGALLRQASPIPLDLPSRGRNGLAISDHLLPPRTNRTHSQHIAHGATAVRLVASAAAVVVVRQPTFIILVFTVRVVACTSTSPRILTPPSLSITPRNRGPYSKRHGVFSGTLPIDLCLSFVQFVSAQRSYAHKMR